MWGWSGPGAPGWTPGHLDTACDGYLGHQAGEPASGITARARAGGWICTLEQQLNPADSPQNWACSG